MMCRRCRSESPAGFRFCGHCGSELASGHPADAPPWELVESERRQLTVMFCDLVDSTPLSESLDPEDLMQVLRSYQQICASVVREYGGHIAQYRGDGLQVFFSYPHAHDDAAERAVRAGLGVVAALEAANPGLEREYGVRLAVRIGIHTGQVVVGEVVGARHEVVAVGRAPNVAARLEGLARPGWVVISEDMLRLVPGLFVTEDLGVRSLRGVAEPVRVHRAVRLTGAATPLEAAGSAAVLPRFVGRRAEMDALLARWERARGGQGMLVVVEGEAGIGKSRLVFDFRQRLAGDRQRFRVARASTHQSSSALHPVIGLLRDTLGLTDDEPHARQLLKLGRTISRAGLPAETCMPLLAELLSLPPGGYAPPALSAPARRRRTLEVLVEWLLAAARQVPTVMLLEDAHWADPSTIELAGAVVDRIASAPLLLLVTARPPFAPTWTRAAGAARIVLGPLAPAESAALVQSIPGADALTPDTVARIVARTDGVPLFAEELTKSVVEVGCDLRDTARSPVALLDGGVPARLQDPLLARLDRLGAAKSVAQLAAVCGREFTLDLVEAVAPPGVAEVRPALAQLMAAGLVYRRSDPARSVYTFRHALIHDAAYGSVLRETRRAWHARIARVLESQPGARESAPHELARHFEAGGLPGQAIDCYRDAAARAVGRSESVEALAHFRAAIALVGKLPPGEARDSLELALLLGQGQCAVALRGWGSAEAREAYQRARDLCERVEEDPQVFLARRGLVTFYTSHCRLDDAHELARELLRQAERSGDVTLRLVAHQQIAIVCFYLGDHADALRHHESALALHDPGVHDALTHVFGGHLGVFIRIWMAWALWTRGQADRALECGLRAIVLARSSGHAFSLAYALLWIAILRLLRREYAVARHLADEATTIASEQEFAFLRAIGRITHALAQLHDAPSAEDALHALAAFDSASKELPALMNQIGVPLIYAFLADVCLARDDAARAEQALASAFAISESAPLPYWDAELLRLRACLLQMEEAPPSEIERLLDESLAVARKQGALGLELRTTRTLAAWRYAHGAHIDAAGLLADVCQRFSEGFECADLQEALRELALYRAAAPPPTRPSGPELH